jgi:TPR repeat protein
MSTVFISYRRQTAAGEARALFSDLVARLGRSCVFMDVDSISLGRDFRNELQTTLEACDLMLVLIDRDWAAAKDERGQVRLENAADFVRMEIEAGLKRDIAVTPVLVKGAQMPTAEELPAEIRSLAYRNGFELSHNRWESDVREMIRRLNLNAPEQGRQVETHCRPMAPAEAGDGSVSAGAKPRVDQEGPTQAAEDRRGLAPPTARQASQAPVVIASVLGVICLGGAAAWLMPDPSRRPQTTATLPLPATAPAVAPSAQTLSAKDDPQSAASAQTNLAINYMDGLGGLPKDDREAARLFKLAADQGNALAQSKLGAFYKDGLGGLPKDYREAARLFKLAADRGEPFAQAELGVFYKDGLGGLPKDDREAARLFKLAADRGDAFAQGELGVFYKDGLGGLPKDYREAARLFKLAADRGEPFAQGELGVFYKDGLGGLPKDYREAARLFKLAADRGEPFAQGELGAFYKDGLGGLPKDYREAARLFKLAADRGDAFAQGELGVFYKDGLGGLPKDYREAARLFKLAADRGDAFAQGELGVFYRDGLGGLPKDRREAARLFKLAADKGDAFARAALTRLKD